MKKQYLQKILLLVTAFTASMFFTQYSLAENTSGSISSPEASKAEGTGQTVPQISYGISQVLQLAHAKISDSTIIAYIRNSGTVYKLDASRIVFLKKQGLSEAVIAAMINHGSSATAAVKQNTEQTKSANAKSDQTVTVVAPPATAYVVPDTRSYYYYSPYYYPYGYYWWQYPPVISFSFGFGGGYHGGFHGGYHGGYHGGGGHHR